MVLIDAINQVLDEIVITALEEAVNAKPEGGYRLMLPNRSRIMILSRHGIPTAILKTMFVSASKYSLIKVKQMCSELSGVYDKVSSYNPSVGVLVAGTLSPAARNYLHAAGIKQSLIDYTTVQAIFDDIGIDVRDIFGVYGLQEDQLDQVTERLLDANRLTLSCYVNSLLLGTARIPSTTMMLIPDDLHEMAISTQKIARDFLGDLFTESVDDNDVITKSVKIAKLKDALDSAFCSGFRKGKASLTQSYR